MSRPENTTEALAWCRTNRATVVFGTDDVEVKVGGVPSDTHPIGIRYGIGDTFVTAVHDCIRSGEDDLARDAAAHEADPEPIFTLRGADGDESSVTLSAFLADNEDLVGTSVDHRLRSMRVGETHRDGGGAQPEWLITRVS